MVFVDDMSTMCGDLFDVAAMVPLESGRNGQNIDSRMLSGGSSAMSTVVRQMSGHFEHVDAERRHAWAYNARSDRSLGAVYASPFPDS